MIIDREEFIRLSKEFAEPVDFNELVASGALIQKGKSYYLVSLSLMPKRIQRKIKTIEQTRNGAKVTFYK